jgi:hypothetical protein
VDEAIIALPEKFVGDLSWQYYCCPSGNGEEKYV